jgi:hypothetical protein
VPNDLVQSGYGQYCRGKLDMTGLNAVKGDVLNLTVGFETVSPATPPTT